jgi:WD40 repeat protein
VTASNDKSLYWWEFKPIDSLSKTLVSAKDVRAEGITLAENGQYVFARISSGTGIEVIGEDQKPTRSLQPQYSSLALAQWQGKPMLALGDFNGQVTFTNLMDGKVVRDPVKLANGSVRSLAVSEDGSLLAASYCMSTRDCDNLALVNLQTGQPVALPENIKRFKLEIVTALAASPDGKSIAIGGPSGQLILYNLEKGEYFQVSTDQLTQGKINLEVTSLAFSPDEEGLLAVGFHTGQVALWKSATRGPIGEFIERTDGAVTGLTFRKDANDRWMLLSTSSKGEVREWTVDLQSWLERACLIAGRELSEEEKTSYLAPGMPQGPVCQ